MVDTVDSKSTAERRAGSSPARGTRNKYIMSTIFLFREPRTGSTWFSNHLAKHLNRKHCFIENEFALKSMLGFSKERFLFEINKHDMNNTLFSTHLFEFLPLLEQYENPIVIRCSRRDKFDQFLSHNFLKYSQRTFGPLTNIISGEIEEKCRTYFDELISTQTVVSKNEVISYMHMVNEWNSLWNQYASRYENYTVYYEDLCDSGIDIPSLGLYNCKMNVKGTTMKLPEYKSKVFLNYEMIHKWIKELDRS